MEIDSYFETLGEYGRYNLVLLPLVLVAGGAIPAWHILASVFVFYEPPHHCATSGDLNVSIPLTDDGELEECRMYSGNQSVTCQDGWSYKGDAVTIVTEMDLVCDKSIYATNAVSIYFAGVLVSAFVGGHLSDIFGRKKMAFIGMTGGLVAGVSLTFTYSYPVFLVVWFFSAIFIARIWSSFFTLIIEIYSSKLRAAAGCLLSLSWSIGLCILSLIAYLLQDWRHFELAISLPILLALPSWWFIVESPRWLMSKNRWAEAKTAFRKIAKFNNIPEDKLAWIENIEDVNNVTSEDNRPNKRTRLYTVIDTLRTPRMRKTTLLMLFIWFVNSMVYYGSSLNSSKIAGDRFINFLVLAVAEIPAGTLALYALPRYGRRRLLFLFHSIVAVACIVMAFIPEETESGVNLVPLITTLAFIGKLCISITFTIIWVFTSEIYPTIIRITGVTTCSMFARFGGIAAPYIMHLGKVMKWLPMLVYGTLSLVAGFAALPLPETLNQPLPQTIDDVENPNNKTVNEINDGTKCELGEEMEDKSVLGENI